MYTDVRAMAARFPQSLYGDTVSAPSGRIEKPRVFIQKLTRTARTEVCVCTLLNAKVIVYDDAVYLNTQH